MRALKSVLLVFSIFAVIMLFVGGFDCIASFKTPVDLYGETTNVSDITRTTPVEADVYAVLDCFVTEKTTTTKNGTVTGTDYDYYYIIPAYDGDETYYVGIKVPEDEDYEYDEICNQTWEWLMGDIDDIGEKTVHAEGCLKKMDDELYDYMVEWFEESEWFESDSDIEKYALPLYLDPVKFSSTRTMTIVAVGTLVVCLVLFIVFGKIEKKQTKKAQAQTHVVINGVSYPKEAFRNVNRCIANRENVFAIQELCSITGLTPEEAQPIIQSWNKYYL
ncbi:MAG: hypothetical protein J6J86_02105 [Lachnospiraceae bacterium]|nr:hypothetical protein [Lachnospiraceae bacterium]